MLGKNHEQAIQFPSPRFIPHPRHHNVRQTSHNSHKQDVHGQSTIPIGSNKINSAMVDKDSKGTTNPFLVQNFNQSSFSGLRRSNFILSHGKRKSDTESSFHPRTKQLITEERITASMRSLSLEMNPAGANNIQNDAATNRTIDEGFYEENMTNVDVDLEDDEHDSWNGSKMRHIFVTPGIKESLKRFDEDILPRQIIDDMQRSCLAVIPYNPSPLLKEGILSKKSEEIPKEKEAVNETTLKEVEKMDADSYD